MHFCTTYSIPWTKGKNYVYKFAITRKVVPEKVLEWPNIDTQPKKWNVQWLQWYIHYRTIGHVWPHPRAINIRASLGILCVVVTAVDIFKTRSMNRTARLSIWLIYMVALTLILSDLDNAVLFWHHIVVFLLTELWLTNQPLFTGTVVKLHSMISYRPETNQAL